MFVPNHPENLTVEDWEDYVKETSISDLAFELANAESIRYSNYWKIKRLEKELRKLKEGNK